MHEKDAKSDVEDKFFSWDFDYLVKIEKSIKKVLTISDDNLLSFHKELLEEIEFRKIFKRGGASHD